MQGVLALDRVTVRDADFSRAAFERFAPNGCVFERCDFRGEHFDERLQTLFASRRQSVFRECRFEGADLRFVRPGQARFERCSFAGANIDGWVSACAEFLDCRFTGPIRNVTFHGKPWGHAAERIDPARSVNAFSGNDFTEAELISALFVNGIEVTQQRWPASESYVVIDRIHQRATRARSRILEWKDHERRNEALAMLQQVAFVFIHQNGIATQRVDDRWPAQAEIQREVWETLEHAL
ncbi:MAG: pentapeptide repeat-containing protein [Chloroflexi bacterium]|nr:MAG: pentapeptide repeat-containing protein [Chloroflexota bacterium]TMG72118.1 MAG: pentapeptide repeat-containing protein [Chloroflexota bacterium]